MKIGICTAALGILLGSTLVPSNASAEISIRRAEIFEGSISVSGRSAPAEETVLWEGQDTGKKTNRRGRFRFVTTTLPSDCVGEVKIGAETRDVVVKYCSPQGPKGDTGAPGPIGETGPQGPKGDNG